MRVEAESKMEHREIRWKGPTKKKKKKLVGRRKSRGEVSKVHFVLSSCL